MFNLSCKKIHILALFTLFGLLLAPAVLALELDYPSWFPLEDIDQAKSLSKLVLALFNVFLVAAGAVSFLMLVVGGIRYLTAFGSPSKLSEAREQIISVLIGFTVLLSSFLLLQYLNPQLLELREPVQPPLKPVVVAGPDKITVRVELDSPEETKFEYAFSKYIAETVVVATIDSRKLNLSFNPITESFALCFEGAPQPVAWWAALRPFDFIADYYALAQNEVCFWTKAQVVSGSDTFDWQEESVTEPVTLKGMITVAVGLPTPPPRHFGYLDYVPLGKNVEKTVEFLEQQQVVFKLTKFAELSSQRSRDKCSGGKCEYKYQWCTKMCDPKDIDSDVGVACCEKECTTTCYPCCSWDLRGNCTKTCPECCKYTCTVPCLAAEDLDNGCCEGQWKAVDPVPSCGPGNTPGTCSPADKDKNRTPCLDKESDIDTKISDLKEATNTLQDPKFKTVLQKGLIEEVDCLNQEGRILLSCEDAEIWFEDEEGGMRLEKDINGVPLWPCEKGKDFVCTWAEGEEEFAQKIVFPIEVLKENYEKVKNLDTALWNRSTQAEYCRCENMNYSCESSITASLFKDFTCEVAPSDCKCFANGEEKSCPWPPGPDYNQKEDCAHTCNVPVGEENQQAPFPQGFNEARGNAYNVACSVAGCEGSVPPPDGIVDLNVYYVELKKNLDQIISWTAFEQMDTCYEIKSLLKSYLDSGDVADCPPTDIYPCCPPQQLTNPDLQLYIDLTETVKNCSDADFFYCNPPSTTQPPSVVVPPGGNCSGIGKDCAGSLPDPEECPAGTSPCGSCDPKDDCDRTIINSQWDDEIRLGIDEGIPICGNIDPVRMLKAVMAQESSGDLNVGLSFDCDQQTGDKCSVGLFQLSQHEVDRFGSGCGVPAGIDVVADAGWFAKQENVPAQACVADKVFRDLAQNSKCGCDVRQLSAGYNGGAGACDSSEDCPDCQMCLGQVSRRWECLWDNPEHTECNTGYTWTRRYAPKVKYCYGVF